MLARSLAVVIVSSAMLFAGCQTTHTMGFYVDPAKRNQTPKDCPNEPECTVAVDPSQWEWLPENIKVHKGKKLVLQLARHYNWSNPPITLKTGVPANYLDCSEKNGNELKCKVSQEANVEKFGYTIRVQLMPDYDPFVWPKN